MSSRSHRGISGPSAVQGKSRKLPEARPFNPHSDRVQFVVAALSAANYLEAAIAISSGLRAGALRKTDRAIEVGRDEKTLVAHRKPP